MCPFLDTYPLCNFHKYESVAFQQLTKDEIWLKIDPFTKCQTHTVKKHTPLQYTLLKIIKGAQF